MLRWKASGRYSRGGRQALFCGLAALGLVVVSVPAKAKQKFNSKSDFCSQVGKTIGVSSGARMWCFGPQPNGPGDAAQRAAIEATRQRTSRGLANVDAANRAEDRTGSGTYIAGQSETSIAASGSYVVEAWNDATGFFAGCGSPNYKEELTGYAFSSNGGRSFTDLGGLPNDTCTTGTRWEGDPSVGVYTNSGFTYFYISSLYAIPVTLDGFTTTGLAVAVSACQVTGDTLSCNQPIIVATSDCNSTNGCTTSGTYTALDKDFLTIDQARKRLYISFTDFDAASYGFNAIELAACDLDNPASPVCSNGTSFGQPYLVVQPGDVNGCEQEGAYPAVRPATGDVYVGWEYNWATNFLGGSACVDTQPTLVVVADVPQTCLPDPDSTPLSPCTGPFNQNSNVIVSIDAVTVPGYNRSFPGGNDFPRIAVSEPYKTVSLVWNDARNTPLGDIFLQSYSLDSLDYVQGSPVRLNTDDSSEDMHILPGLRNASSDGLINVTWYDRRGRNAGTGKTDVYGALNVKPTTESTPSSNLRITNESTDWLATYSVIIPNFGDYTDNYVSTSNKLFVAWSDGRSGVPQPYEAHVGVH